MLAAGTVLVGKPKRLVVHERPQHRVDRVRRELLDVRGAHAAQQGDAVRDAVPDALLAETPGRKDELPEPRLHELAAVDDPVLAERTGERQRTRSANERAVQVETGG